MLRYNCSLFMNGVIIYLLENCVYSIHLIFYVKHLKLEYRLGTLSEEAETMQEILKFRSYLTELKHMIVCKFDVIVSVLNTL